MSKLAFANIDMQYILFPSAKPDKQGQCGCRGAQIPFVGCSLPVELLSLVLVTRLRVAALS